MKYNTEKTYVILTEKYNVNISKLTIYKIYKEIGNIIYKYMLIVYYSEPLIEINEGDFIQWMKSCSIITTPNSVDFRYH